MAKVRVKTTVTDRDLGFKKLAAELGGMGTVTLGVQGEEASSAHPSGLTVGEIASMHELGIGVPERSWLRSWMDANQDRMAKEVRHEYQQVLQGKQTRAKALQGLGYKWVAELRKNIADGNIRPPLAPYTVQKKGHDIPLLETGTLANSITYKVFLKQIKGILSAMEREAVRSKK